MTKYFHYFAERTSRAFGTPHAFVIALLTVIIWAAVGPAFHFDDSWQLTINTGTTIVTFLMVFLIQNTQNRDARANQLKLDELLRAVEEARTSMVNVDELTEEQLTALEAEFRRLGRSVNAATSPESSNENEPPRAERR